MSEHDYNKDFCASDIHDWFGLTYSSYFAMPRSVLQSMPADWQHRFVELMGEAEELYGGYDMQYTVMAKDDRGRFVADPLRDYERGRRFVEPYSLDDKYRDTQQPNPSKEVV